MITTYATVAQFFLWCPGTILGSRTVADVQNSLDTFSSEMDDRFRGRWVLPFAAVGLSVSRKCVQGARYIFLGGRGFDPQTDADRVVLTDYGDAIVWLDLVQRRGLHPDVTLQSAPSALDQPFVVSSSVVNVATGQRARNRGW